MVESADKATDKAPPNLGDTASGASGPSRTVLDGPDITRALTRITHEILERNRGSADLPEGLLDVLLVLTELPPEHTGRLGQDRDGGVQLEPICPGQ